MKFYAYIQDKNGKEPIGTHNKFLFELKTINGAKRKLKKIFKDKEYKLFLYNNFYDEKSYKEIK